MAGAFAMKPAPVGWRRRSAVAVVERGARWGVCRRSTHAFRTKTLRAPVVRWCSRGSGRRAFGVVPSAVSRQPSAVGRQAHAGTSRRQWVLLDGSKASTTTTTASALQQRRMISESVNSPCSVLAWPHGHLTLSPILRQPRVLIGLFVTSLKVTIDGRAEATRNGPSEGATRDDDQEPCSGTRVVSVALVGPLRGVIEGTGRGGGGRSLQKSGTQRTITNRGAVPAILVRRRG